MRVHSRLPALAAVALALPAIAGCGRASSTQDAGASGSLGVKSPVSSAPADLGFPVLATRNTVRIAGASPVQDAAATARIAYPASGGPRPGARPPAVTLVDAADWRAALVSSVLFAAPLGAPVLFTEGEDIPPATADALAALRPTGARSAGGAQAIRVGSSARPQGLRLVDVAGGDPYTLARSVDAFSAAARGTTSDQVMIVSADAPAYAMPAAAWAAKSGTPILFVTRSTLPAATAAALRAHQQPKIYVLGPPSVVDDGVLAGLRKLGAVTRVGAPDPVGNAVAFARFRDARFGWGITDPGHGFVFASTARTQDAAAGAPLSASGAYGPLLLLPPGAAAVPASVRDFLLDVQPGYTDDPVRGVYNRGWLLGDEQAITRRVQAELDQLLEIVPVNP